MADINLLQLKRQFEEAKKITKNLERKSVASASKNLDFFGIINARLNAIDDRIEKLENIICSMIDLISKKKE